MDLPETSSRGMKFSPYHSNADGSLAQVSITVCGSRLKR